MSRVMIFSTFSRRGGARPGRPPMYEPLSDRVYEEVEIQAVSAKILSEIQAFPPAVFEDKHENLTNGPFGQHKSVN